jgi:hypothetical protein
MVMQWGGQVRGTGRVLKGVAEGDGWKSFRSSCTCFTQEVQCSHFSHDKNEGILAPLSCSLGSRKVPFAGGGVVVVGSWHGGGRE